MPHVSRIRLSKRAEKELLHTLDVILTKIVKEEDIDTFLMSLLTPTERLMIAKRLAITILLKEGISDTQIAETLHVTRVTVSRLRYFYESRGVGYEIVFKILSNEKIAVEIRNTLLGLVGYSIRAVGERIKI